jgi:hypothetical protein
MKVWLFFQPNSIKISLALAILLATLLIVSRHEPTSKVSWEQYRGAPLPFLSLTEYRGPCGLDTGLCINLHFQAIHPGAMLVNLLGWYTVSCILVLGYEKIFRHQIPSSNLIQ